MASNDRSFDFRSAQNKAVPRSGSPWLVVGALCIGAAAYYYWPEIKHSANKSSDRVADDIHSAKMGALDAVEKGTQGVKNAADSVDKEINELKKKVK